MSSEIKESIIELNLLFTNEKEKQVFFEHLQKSTLLTNYEKLNLDIMLVELINNIYQITSNKLNSHYQNLETLYQEKKSFVDKFYQRQQKAANQTKTKANDFAWNLRDTLFEIENYITNNLCEKPTLEKIAEEFNKRKIKTPNDKDFWFPSTVQKIKLRIQKIQPDTVSNALQ